MPLLSGSWLWLQPTYLRHPPEPRKVETCQPIRHKGQDPGPRYFQQYDPHFCTTLVRTFLRCPGNMWGREVPLLSLHPAWIMVSIQLSVLRPEFESLRCRSLLDVTLYQPHVYWYDTWEIGCPISMMAIGADVGIQRLPPTFTQQIHHLLMAELCLTSKPTPPPQS